jgi:cold shock CspA family protein
VTRRTGSVVEFDEHVGLGVVEGSGGDRERFPFHCTRIADGSRTIGVGTAVSFAVVAGRGGRWEAADLKEAPAGSGR